MEGLSSNPGTPNSRGSVESLAFYLENCRLNEVRQGTTSSVPLLSDDFGDQYSEQQSQNWDGLKDDLSRISTRADQGQCLNSQDIWGHTDFSYRGDLPGSNLFYGPGSPTSSSGYGNMYNLDYQKSNVVRGLSGETMGLSSGSLAPSLSNFMSQCEGEFLLANPANMLHNDLNLYCTIANQNSSVDRLYETSGRDSFYLDNGYYFCNSPGISDSSRNQETLDTAGVDCDKELELWQGYDMALLATTRIGSRYLQDLLHRRYPRITNKIVEGVIQSSLFRLMTDQYGTHLFQKLIEFCNPIQMTKIAQKLFAEEGSLASAALDQFGSPSVQKLIKVLKESSLLPTVMSALAPEFYRLMIHQSGKFVIWQCLTLLSNSQNKFLFEEAIEHCIELAMNQVGCITLNKCINYIKGQQRGLLLNVISEKSVLLSQDPSGNYVLQYVLKLDNPVLTFRICSRLQGRYIQLSTQKSGSHVVETCLRSSGWFYVIDELVASRKLFEVAKDQFGNYVIQTAWKIKTNTNHQSLLLDAIKPHLSQLQRHPIGRNVYNLIMGEVSFLENRFGLERRKN